MNKSGFTLVELMISVMLFSAILATFFSVVGSVRKAEAFRDATLGLTQGAQFGFEPMIRSIKEADGLELITVGPKSFCVRGFYARDTGPLDPTIKQTGEITLTTLSLARKKDESGADKRILTRHDYKLADGNQVVETTYELESRGTSCSKIDWSTAIQSTRTLTPSTIRVTTLSLSVIAPLLLDDQPTVLRQPSARLELVVNYPKPKIGIAPFGLRTTVTPTFIYSEKKE